MKAYKVVNKVYLTSDAMVNLKTGYYNFTALGNGEYTSTLTDVDLKEFLKLNNCDLTDGKIIDLDAEFKNEIWGTVIEVRG